MALHRAGQAHAERLHRELHGRLRDELLNETLFSALSQARATLSGWRSDYNGSRPHSALGWRPRPPSPPPSIRDGICRCAKSKAPRQIPPLTRPKGPNPPDRTNSPLDKTWGQRQGGCRQSGLTNRHLAPALRQSLAPAR
ncbi:integrase core domain-containing protein [Xanthobacter aminoxidans]|uniref:integrase core domain-containing protein n=1 Tax=Xanthobacter aminoxidans TaxID=186280 RepID=UPI003D65A385